MPFLKVQTNSGMGTEVRNNLMKSLSKTVADQLGKPERYVMVAIESGAPMMFGGSDEPLAYMELKSIGLPEASTPSLSESLCAVIEEELGIPGDRIYIEFADAKGRMWGWNKDTF